MWIKICGVRDVESAVAAADSGADAVGLNFYRSSPRFVEAAVARRIAAAVHDRLEVIGVFVDEPVDEVIATCNSVGIRTVQLHGDEPPVVLAGLQSRGLKVLRAIRVADDLAEISNYLAGCRSLQVEPAACLIDARVAGSFGGTGKTAPWELLSAEYDFGTWPPMILAGGLVPENVAEAIRTVRPWGIDTASGVESAPGVKDRQRVQAFIDAARAVQAEDRG